MKKRLHALVLWTVWLASPPLPAQPSDASAHVYEGTQLRALRVDPAWIAIVPVGASGSPLFRIDDPAQPAGLRSPVYREADQAHSPARALPGGVIVALRSEDRAQPDRLFEALGLRARRSIDPTTGRWLVDSAPGADALSLARRLHESGRFESVAPNWWRERVRK